MFNRVFATIGLVIVLAGCGAANVPSTDVQDATPQPTTQPAPTSTATQYPTVPAASASTPVLAEATAPPAPDPTKSTGADTAEDVLLVWSRSGGFAGFRDSMTVYADGRLEIDHNGTIKQGKAPTMTMEELRSAFATDEWKALQPEYGQAIPDGFIYSIKVGDRRVTAHDGSEIPEPLATILQQCASMFESGQ